MGSVHFRWRLCGLEIMNVFDFDGTLYDGDSTLDFWRYALSKHPACIRSLPGQVLGFVLHAVGAIDKNAFKARFYSFLKYVPETKMLVEAFWDEKQGRISETMLKLSSEGDLVVSASPSFLIEPICNRLGLYSIASEVSPFTGELLGPNCSGPEKCRRIMDESFEVPFENGYTDSVSDGPMMSMSTRPWMVAIGVDEVKLTPFYNGCEL